MRPVAIVAAGAVSAQGVGQAAYAVGGVGERARTAIAHDPELALEGIRFPSSGRVRVPLASGSDRAHALLSTAASELVRALDRVLPEWRKKRVGLCLGTSGGGLPSLTRWLAARAARTPERDDAELARASFYFGPLAAIEQAVGVEFGERSLLLSACSSSTMALGLGARWLEAHRADLVIAGGFDALSLFIAAGFEALRATSPSPPRPFRVGREGMALGEGAALCALARADEAPPAPLGYVLGFGASADAVHVTAPDRTGAGLARAAERALHDASVAAAEIDLVSAHATATPYNDAAEANALERVFASGQERVVVHPFKATIGHAFGAAGALESLAALDAMQASLFPAAAGDGAIEPNLRARLLEVNTAGRPSLCLKLSSAFGGANAALVLGTRQSRSRSRTPVRVMVRAVGRPRSDLDGEAEQLGVDPMRLARLDPLSRLCVAACFSALEGVETPSGDTTGIVIGTASATIETNEVFHARLRERGVRAVEPRRFPPTSPNLAAGECSILFGWRGPALGVGADAAAPLEALLCAYDLLEAGDATRLLVVAAEHVGTAVTDLFAAAGWPVPRAGALAVVLEASDSPGSVSLERAAIQALQSEARAGQGRLGSAEPGWPCLVEALRRLGVTFRS